MRKNAFHSFVDVFQLAQRKIVRILPINFCKNKLNTTYDMQVFINQRVSFCLPSNVDPN